MNPLKKLYKIVSLPFFLLISIFTSAKESDITMGLINRWTINEPQGTVAVNSADVNFNSAFENTILRVLYLLPSAGAIGGASQFNCIGGCFIEFFKIHANRNN